MSFYEPHIPETASKKDRVAWMLCQIIDDDAPLRWTRFRFFAGCIAANRELMSQLNELSTPVKQTPLSDRVRPDVEAAPWVIDEIRKLESALQNH